MKSFLGTAAIAALMGLTNAAQLDPIHTKGSKFFYENGTQFFMKGVAYQSDSVGGAQRAEGVEPTSYNDPLADVKACQRDVSYLKDLGVNTIRVYAIDPKKDHSTCMKLLNDAGIYVVADLSEPKLSINRDSPAWNDKLYVRYTAVVDELSKYPNVLGFFAGNEVSNNVTNTGASAFVKAAVGDMKAYIKKKGYRKIPVGYATNDDADIRVNIANYFNCGPRDLAIDFWGYNIYSWCGDSSFEESGYDKRTEELKKLGIPIFFAEFGCNKERPRKFSDIDALFGPDMVEAWSGGIVYMFHEEANEYGLVKISGSEVETLEDYDNLKEKYASVSPSGVQESEYTPSNTAGSECPAVGSDWKASSALPPTPDKDFCGCMVKSLECVVDSKVNGTGYGNLFGYLCGPDVLGKEGCAGISSDATEGKYGPYSACSAEEQLSLVMDINYQNQNKNPSGCDFDGQAKTKTASSDANCAKQIENAGGLTATAISNSGSSSERGSSQSKNASPMTLPSMSMALLNMGIALTVAFFGGVGLVVM